MNPVQLTAPDSCIQTQKQYKYSRIYITSLRNSPEAPHPIVYKCRLEPPTLLEWPLYILSASFHIIITLMGGPDNKNRESPRNHSFNQTRLT